MSGYGYGETKRRRDRAASSSPDRAAEKRPKGKKEKKEKKAEKHREDAARRKADRTDRRSRSRRRDDRPRADEEVRPAGGKDLRALTSNDAGGPQGRGAWREELARAEPEDDAPVDGFVHIEDDEEVERKLAESRARREALIAKWVNRGEHVNGSLEAPDTPAPEGEGSSDSDGEVSDGEGRQDASMDGVNGAPDEAELEKRRAIARFIVQAKAEHDGDMFGEDESQDGALNRAHKQSAAISQTGASADDWDDVEGYYKAKIGEVMGERYLVVEDMCGKGVFSNVIKAKDQNGGELVAIKIMRCNDMMRKAAEKEVEILERLCRADKGGKRHVIRLFRTFNYRGHLCLVFECMWDNLRVALKKYTKDKGMSLQAVRAYTKQLLIALRHIHRAHIVHADIKPDNILISAGHNMVKICDLGSAMELSEVEATPYLVSRFYRAPEIILGKEYTQSVDTFAMGATMYELFTGRILFPGKTNNDMLRLMMEVKGKLPHKMIKSGMFWKQHFDDNLDFKFFDTDKATRKKVTRVITDLTAKKGLEEMIMQRVGPEKRKSQDPEDQLYVKKAKQFADLLDKMVALNPETRISPNDALQHPFLTEAGPGSKAKEAAKPTPGKK